jgi:L-asparaginase
MRKSIAFLIILITAFLCFSTNTNAEQKLPLVKVLATGGTIVNLGGTTKDFEGLSGADLVASVPGLDEYARVEVEQVVNLPSSRLTPDVWLTIAKRINEIFRDDPEVAGVVITHGTDTMEETAYFLNLTIKSEKPVVLTGAMISAKYQDSDGPRNLLSAVRVAASENAKGKGVLLLSNERQVFAARDVEKNKYCAS